MSLANYTDLKTAIETWRARVGVARITANAADCVALGEARLNRELPLRMFKSNTTLTATPASRELSLPSDFVEAEFLKITNDNQFDEIKKRPAATMRYYFSEGEPTEWCINGSKIDLNRPAASAYTFSFRYRQKLDLASTTTNWLLSNHPDIYLASVLVQSGLLIKDDDVVTWGAILRDGIEKLTMLDSQSDGDVEMVGDPALLNRGYYDYLTDTHL